jgi:hypothetical protein
MGARPQDHENRVLKDPLVQILAMAEGCGRSAGAWRGKDFLLAERGQR